MRTISSGLRTFTGDKVIDFPLGYFVGRGPEPSALIVHYGSRSGKGPTL